MTEGRLKYWKYSGPRREASFHPRKRTGLLERNSSIPGRGWIPGCIMRMDCPAMRGAMEKFTALDVPPPGAGFTTVTTAVPAVAMSLELICAESRFGFCTNVCRL